MSEPGPEFERVGDWPDVIGHYRGALAIPHAPDGRVLVQMRDDIEGIAMPGKWGFFGGEIDPGETPVQAVAREFLEETGLSLPEVAFTPAYAVITSPPKLGLLYVFTVPLTYPCSDIRVLEGGGFALATRRQAEKLDMIVYIRDVLDKFWSQA